MKKIDPLLWWVVVALLIVVVLAYTLPRVPAVSDMANQPSIKPQERIFLPPVHAIPVQGQEPQRDVLEALELENPVEATPTSLANGKQLYDIYCSICHGAEATGKGAIAAKLTIPPDDLTKDATTEQPDGYLYQMIRQGGDVMPAEGASLSPLERWDIVNYLRSLQKRG